jgi:pyridoxamine 5'-phosphate oxidase
MEAIIDVAALRKEYTLNGLFRKDLHLDPFEQFRIWFEESVKTAGDREPNAMTLATVDRTGRPSARVVLLKGFDKGGFTFFTNYQSRKAEQLSQNPYAALNFHWPWLERQVEIEGRVDKVTRRESKIYFNKRPLGSRFGALASAQSSVIENRQQLERRDFWGGYRLFPDRIEFWQGRENRLHDRFLYYRDSDPNWRIERLSP